MPLALYDEKPHNVAFECFLDEIIPDADMGLVYGLKRKVGSTQYHFRAYRAKGMLLDGSFGRFCNYYTPNLYKVNGKEIKSSTRTSDAMVLISVMAIDIDYYKIYEKDYWTLWQMEGPYPTYTGNYPDPMSFFHGVIEEHIGGVIPEPSYIEYSYGLRLIYVFEDPIKLSGKKPKGAKSITKAYSSTVSKLTAALNEAIGCKVCEAQPMNTFYRVPGTKNEKNKSVVRFEAYSDIRYTLQEIMDGYLPSLPKWYEDRDVMAVEEKKGLVKIHSPYLLWRDRIEIFKEVARTERDINREKLCHLYLNGLIETNYDGDLWDALCAFNETLIEPLEEKELDSKCGWQIKDRKSWKYSNERINEVVGIEIFDNTPLGRGRAKILREKAGTTRKQVAERHYREVIELKKKGLTNPAIAENVGIALKTVKNLVTRAYKENLLAKDAEATTEANSTPESPIESTKEENPTVAQIIAYDSICHTRYDVAQDYLERGG